MPLQDTFKKKTTEARKVDPLKVSTSRQSPTQDDLRFCMGQAAQNIGRPAALSWRAPDAGTYLLMATINQGAHEVNWTLQVGDDVNLSLLWNYTSSDPLLIHSFLAQLEQQADQPKAEIPESLRPAPATTESAPPAEGTSAEVAAHFSQDEFSNEIEVLQRIGYGGMGVIYKARRKSTGEIVALKVLHGHLLEDPENTTRFMQEASACLELKHRNLINVHEFGISKSGQPYMVMEYLEGKPLTHMIEKQGRLELAHFINLFTQICDGLQFAHEKGIVHRDVKPSNIMIIAGEGGIDTAKLLDFGIAKLRAETDQKHLTPTGNVLGSPAYIAPEQCAGQKAEPSIDVYALGCVMYEALSGRPPFVHESAIKVLMMQLGEPAPPLSSVCPDPVPPQLEGIIMRCLEKSPDARYKSASDLDAELWEFAYLYSRETGGDQASEESSSTESEQLVASETSSSESIDQADPQAQQSPNQDSSSAHETPVEKMQPDLQLPTGTEGPRIVSVEKFAQQRESSSTMLMVRLKRCRSIGELDCAWEGLNMALKLQSRNVPVSVLLDAESVLLVIRTEVSASKFGLDVQALRRISAMQGMLQQFLKSGGMVQASERWAKRGTEPNQIMPGVKLLSDDEMCDLLIERKGSIVEY